MCFLNIEEAVFQTPESTVLMVASVMGVLGGTILLGIVIWCLCMSKICRRKNQVCQNVTGPKQQ